VAECGGIWTVTGGQGRHDPENRTRGDWRSSNPGGRTAGKERTSESERGCGVHERKSLYSKLSPWIPMSKEAVNAIFLPLLYH